MQGWISIEESSPAFTVTKALKKYGVCVVPHKIEDGIIPLGIKYV